LRSLQLPQKHRLDEILARFALTSASCEQIDARYAGIFIAATSVKHFRTGESFGVTVATCEVTFGIAGATCMIGEIDSG